MRLQDVNPQLRIQFVDGPLSHHDIGGITQSVSTTLARLRRLSLLAFLLARLEGFIAGGNCLFRLLVSDLLVAARANARTPANDLLPLRHTPLDCGLV